MAKQLVNVGQSVNDKHGDPLRTAFEKINSNFDELYSGGLNGASITTSTTPPSNPITGALWYDEVSGRLYIFFDSSWIDANPALVESINLTTLKSVVAASTSFIDFQSRIAAL
jgi:hypothetical protein